MNHNRDYETSFLNDAAEQIAYKPLRPSIIKELKDHIEDRAGEYEADGMSPEDARKKAVEAMGDGVAVGTGINAVRCVRPNRLLTVLTAILLFSGTAAAAIMFRLPHQSANGFLYYLPGTALLIFITYKGYPGLVTYQRPLLFTAALILLSETAYVLLMRQNIAVLHFFNTVQFIPLYMVVYYTVLLLGPVLVIVIYRLRSNGFRAMAAAVLVSLAVILSQLQGGSAFSLPSAAVFLFSAAGTVLFMIRRNVFPLAKRTLYGAATAGILSVIGLFLVIPGQNYFLESFAAPQNRTSSTWDDPYNGVLIQDLLSKTPLLTGISLTQSEMEDYSSGEWYFGSSDGLKEYQIQDRVNQGTLRRSYYNESGITLWNILPQHYHNNYLIAVLILTSGWLAGILFLAVIAVFYAVIFSCISRTRGALAGSVSFCCGLCLLFQSLLYILGNFGYQYSTFANLPLVSEGRLSIMANMLLLGLIFSAYRYDQVTDPAVRCKSDPDLI